MSHDSPDKAKGPPIYIMVAGLATAALLTLAAAVGTSMLHKKAAEQVKSFEVPVAQR